jgi:recombination protein RecA
MAKPKLSWNEELELIRKKLGHYTSDFKPTHFLDCSKYLPKSGPYLNEVFGRPDDGLIFGKFIEIAGPESHGKSLQELILMAMAQKDGADCLQIDGENSWFGPWAQKWGVDPDRVGLIQPYVGNFGKKQKKRLKRIQEAKTDLKKVLLRLSTAEELCEEAECLMTRMHERHPNGKIFLGIDSVTALLVGDEAEAGITGQNMRTNAALAMFLSRLLRRWVGLAQSYNILGVFINQLRTAPGVMFGDPEYTTGGKALKFYCHVRTRMKRTSKGLLLQSGRPVGIRGTIRSVKNKIGGVEGTSVGYKLLFKGKPRYMDAELIRKEARGPQ